MTLNIWWMVQSTSAVGMLPSGLTIVTFGFDRPIAVGLTFESSFSQPIAVGVFPDSPR